jgi:ABC-type polysaccharide/polyol phosphate transport system ATPase subunit
MSDVHVIVEDASLRFRIYRNPSPNLKETVVQKMTRKNHNMVTEFDALKNINLELYSGDRLGIVGLNGAGKSTLLKMIVGIYPPHSGEIRVHGKITPMIELGTGFDHELSGRENIYLNGALLGRSYKQMRGLEAAIIEFSELGEMIDLPIKYYSTGMHGRLAFSIGAICDPEILLMDEIFAAGDAQFVQKCLDRLHHMMNKSQILVLVSHDNDHILKLCNRAIALKKGQIVKEGSPEEVIDYYMDNIVHDADHPAPPKDEEDEAVKVAVALDLQAQAEAAAAAAAYPGVPVLSPKQTAELIEDRDNLRRQWQERKPVWKAMENIIIDLRKDMETLVPERAQAIVERDQAIAERDRAIAERDQIMAQHSAAANGRDCEVFAPEQSASAGVEAILSSLSNQLATSRSEQIVVSPPQVEIQTAT